ncbi:hypothetical protein [Mastigocoleus sp. MO_188.B34]|uniref:hypothetical protein n=1 Tax=Mastigocoleus sp. MO_188.B34 TaxID=3036635 RepID=UPI002612BFFC|nr:hypothetical protein [Mastigocoleus sp. MO_188.B34]MDJ0696058.1 hypothetical protein [Mastigocoleus sp. MO_188.B34]
MIAITYFLFALALGIQLKDLADKKYFLFVTFDVWLIICLIIYSSTNFMYFQAFYGKYNEDFSGSYQLIGDTFAFVSILLLCRLATLVHTQKESKKIPIKNNILSYEAIIFVSINLTTITSIIFLFLNSSRASFYSSLPVFFYINYCFFSRIKAKRIYMFISILIVSIIISLLLFNTSFLSYIDFSFLIYNRNLEFITTNNSTSLAGRKNVFIIGFQDIMYSPIIGNYVDRMIDRGKGSYIHNIFGMLQDFGMPAFLSYLCLIIYCMRYFLHSWKSTNYYMNMLFNSIFIFSIVELFVFRYPLGFYLIFVVFGLVLKLTSVSKHIY